MEYLRMLIDFILHIDKHLFEIVKEYDTWTYLILFLIIFCETGLVVTPFLPGDSLLFASGALAAAGSLSIPVLYLVILTATFLGDNSNYFIGRFLGSRIYEMDFRLIKRKYIDRTHLFYEKHGGKTVVIARFIPIIRTFAPFVAGAGTMKYSRFILFSIIGTTLWVSTFCFAGYFFANNPFVKEHFSVVVLALIIIPGLPSLYAVASEIIKGLLKKGKDQV
jgi:membrane-associated protein